MQTIEHMLNVLKTEVHSVLKTETREFLSQNKEYKCIVFGGNKPLWNDGEECVFFYSTPTAINISPQDLPDNAIEDFECYVDLEEDFDYKCEEVASLEKILDELGPFTECIFGSNFQVVLQLSEDSVLLEHNKYEPKY